MQNYSIGKNKTKNKSFAMEKSITLTTSNFKFKTLCSVGIQLQKNNLTNFRYETLALLDKSYSTKALLINCFSLKTKSGLK